MDKLLELFSWLESIPTWGFMLFMAGFFLMMLFLSIGMYWVYLGLRGQKQLPPFIEHENDGTEYW